MDARTEIISERVSAQEPNQRVQLPDPVLQRCSGETPLVFRLELESALRSIAAPFLDIVRLVELPSWGLIQLSAAIHRLALAHRAVEYLR